MWVPIVIGMPVDIHILAYDAAVIWPRMVMGLSMLPY